MADEVLKNNLDLSLVHHVPHNVVNRKPMTKKVTTNLTNNVIRKGKKRSKTGCLSCKKLRIKVRIMGGRLIRIVEIGFDGMILTSVV